jgi:hypothetical protein
VKSSLSANGMTGGSKSSIEKLFNKLSKIRIENEKNNIRN